MKKVLLIALSLLLSLAIQAQNNISIINEEFDGATIPSGWYIAGKGLNNWYVSPSFSAGGKPNEIYLSYSPMFNGISRLVSPSVDLTNINNAILSLNLYVSLFGNTGVTIGVATSSDNGVNWNSVWSEKYTETNKQHSIVKSISGPDMGKSDVRFCIYFEGNSSAFVGLYFDNFKVYIIENVGVETTSIDIPKYIIQGEHPISFSVKNVGETTIKSFEARCNINGEEVFSESFYTEMNYLDVNQFTFEDMYDFSFGEDYEIEIEIFRINDEELEISDKFSKEIGIAMCGTQKTTMIEHFSSSTCGPCVDANSSMLELTHNNKDKYTYTKYVANGPGLGDPYYTQEVGSKMSYYNVLSVPQIYFDGVMTDVKYLNDETFQNHYNTPALAKVRGAFTVEGNTINVIADFMTYFDTEDVKAYVSVNEKTTTGNVGTNGEEEFHHVMMKMLAKDNILNLKAGEYQRLEFSYDMSQTFMEDINDLEVALWLQDDETKEIYNSHFAYEYTEHCYPVRNMTSLIDGNNVTIKWDAPEKGNPVGYNVIVNGKLAAEKTTSLEYSSELNGESIVEVVAVYADDKTSVGAAKQITAEDNISDVVTEKDLRIYPNPVRDVLFLATELRVEEIAIYDIYGRLCCTDASNASSSNASSSNAMDTFNVSVRDLGTGIYFVNIKTDKGNIVKRFVKK